jgi:hypothetical protein
VALLVIILGGIMPAVMYFVNVTYELGALTFAQGADFLSVFDKPQRDALAMVLLRLHSFQIDASLVLAGAWLFPLARLVYRSRFLPRFLGVPVDSISCSPDGKTVYFAARGVIWSIPSSAAAGADARKVHIGDSIAMDPSGHRLIVQSQESRQLRRFSVPLDGGPEREIPIDATITSAPIQIFPNAINGDGRLLVSLLLRDSWFNPPA